MTLHSQMQLSADTRLAIERTRDTFVDLAELEAAVTHDETRWHSFQEELAGFREEACALWKQHDHVVVRDAPFRDDGSTLLLLAVALFSEIKTYRGQRVVKHFRMSPWTRALSHTLAGGHFHTDINTAPVPPVATMIQCLRPDPDAPRHGQLRIARLSDLLQAVERPGRDRFRRFLTQDTVTMVNDSAPGAWTGKIIDGQEIRLHPETLRAGQRRCGSNPHDLEECLDTLQRVATEVSEPIDLRAGDVVIVSNRRALHQRGACTVRFRSSRQDFESREVAVLHTLAEPT